MREQKWILVFGADAMLLDTRSRILENAGFGVARSTHILETERELRDKQIALLLLCYTLSSADCERAIEAAHGLNPDTVTLLLSSVSGPVIEKSDVLIHQMNGPQKLLDTVRELLR